MRNREGLWRLKRTDVRPCTLTFVEIEDDTIPNKQAVHRAMEIMGLRDDPVGHRDPSPRVHHHPRPVQARGRERARTVEPARRAVPGLPRARAGRLSLKRSASSIS
jgi:hypothetical protein